ncbi:MAG: hypothetical protein R3C28_29315 [Pirellulaceae bacterium]
MSFDPAAANAVTKPVTLELKSVSRIEAIERVCNQIGIHARYDQFDRIPKSSIGLFDGLRPNPASFVGPFLVTISRFETSVPGRPAVVELSFVAVVPRTVTSVTAHGKWWSPVSFAIESITCNGVKAGFQDSEYQDVMTTTSVVSFTKSIVLEQSDRPIEAIESIAGRLKMNVPDSISEAEMRNPKVGDTQKVGSLEFKVVESKKHQQFRLELSGPDVGQDNMDLFRKLAVTGENEKKETVQIRLSNSWNKSIEITFVQPVATLNLQWIRTLNEISGPVAITSAAN